MVGAIGPLIQLDHPGRFLVIDGIEKVQLHGFTPFREDTDVHAFRVHGRAEGLTQAITRG